MFLESSVVAICSYKVEEGNATVIDLLGTAFFIDRVGHFLTAKHVQAEIGPALEKQGVDGVGLIVKDAGGKSEDSILAKIAVMEDAPSPFDVSIGKTISYRSEVADYILGRSSVDVWRDVATYGYPTSALTRGFGSLGCNIRCLKGYVQRLVPANEYESISGPHPEAYELSFLISKGASGSPLFHWENRKPTVIGICVGSYRSEVTEHSLSEVVDGEKTFSEKLMKVEQFGIAQVLHPLVDWIPTITNGKSLATLQRESLPQ